MGTLMCMQHGGAALWWYACEIDGCNMHGGRGTSEAMGCVMHSEVLARFRRLLGLFMAPTVHVAG